MEEKATLIGSLVDKAEVYAKSSIDLLQLKAIDKSANILSSLMSTIIIAFVILCITIMISIGAALWIDELMESSYYGFFIVASFYIFIAIILGVFRKSLLKMPLNNRFITHFRK